MLSTGRIAVVACAAQISCLVSNHQYRHCRLLKAPCNALQRQMRALQQRIHIRSASSKPDASATPEDVAAVDELFQRWLRLAAAILAAACLHLGTSQVSDALDIASATEDQMLGIVRSLETQMDSAWTALRSATPLGAPSASDPNANAQQAAARELINEVYEVVDRNFSDARSAGFDPEKWRQARDAALSRPIPDAAAAHSAVRRMLGQLKDPYSRFITPEEFSAMAKYDVSGVGLNLGSLSDLRAKTGLEPSIASEEGVWVVGLIRGSAAEVAGMRQGDELLAANGDSVAGQSPFSVASSLQDPSEASSSTKESAVQDSSTIAVRVRHLDGSTEDLTLARSSKPPTPSPVVSKLESGRVGYIKLSSFNARAQRDVAQAVRELQSSGAQRLVLDLRGNRGGLVSEGVEVARLFLDDGAVVVRTKGARARANEPLTAPGPALTTQPLAVLVDSHTASASEILAGALQDNCRGVLVGRRTYGKGLIQSVYELGDGSGLVLTVGKYLTPAGTDIDLDGIVPDFGAMPGGNVADEAIAACRLKPAPKL